MTQPGILPQLPSPRFPKETMLEALRLASGVQTIWKTDREPAFNQRASQEKARIVVGLTAYSSVFIDEKRVAFNAVTQQNDSIVVARRYFPLGLTAESLDHTIEAFDLLERVRVRLRSERILAMLRPTIALRDIKNIVPLNDVWRDNLNVPTAKMDVRLHCCLTFTNQDPYEGDWIATVATPTNEGLIP